MSATCVLLARLHSNPAEAAASCHPSRGKWDVRPHKHNRGMLIALLAVLGVYLITIAVMIAILLRQRAWVSHQPGAFKGAIRVADGTVSGLRPKWKRGVGRWVGDVLVWAKAPSLFRNELVEADRTGAQVRETTPGDRVKRLGSRPVIVAVAVDGARVEIAAGADHGERALGAFAAPTGRHAAGNRTPTPQPDHGTDQTA
jgi:hypothetical protein